MKRPLCWIGLGCFAAAAAFCSFYPAKEWIFPATALFGLSGLFCLLSTRTRPAAIFSFSAAFMLLFCLLYGHLFAKPALDLSGRTLSLSGTVLETGHASFLLDGETESGQALNVQVWCSTDMVPNRYQEFSGIVELSAITSTDRFDSESYYRSRGIYLQGQLLSGSFRDPERISLESLPGRLNDLACQKIRTLLPEKYSGLVCAVALGNRTYQLDEQYDLFVQLGIQHLLAVSGMHLALLTGMFSLLFGRLFRDKRVKILFCMAFVLFYMLLTGMSPSVSRSGIMLLLSYLAQLISRRADTPVSLSAAVLLMLLYNPFIARNTGFLFSVCTTIGVRMLAEPLSEKVLSWKKKNPPGTIVTRFVQACSVAVCGYACAAPLTVLYDAALVPMSILANLLLSPLFTPVLAVSAGLAVFCAVPVLGPFFAFLVRLFGGLFLQAAAFLCRIGPAPVFWSGPAPFIVVLSLAAAIGYGAVRADRRQFAAALCLATVISGAAVSTQALAENRQIHCYTAAFEKNLLQIFSYGGHAIVIGHLSGQSQIEQAALELQRENVHTIDALILLPSGGSPRVSLSALTGQFLVVAAAYSPEDNLSTQAAESLTGIPTHHFAGLSLAFWQNGIIHLYEGGMASIRIGSKKLLILPSDCAILYEKESVWDLAVTSWDISPPVTAEALLCARHFWGTENQNPNAYLLPYGRGIRFRIPTD